MRDQLQKIYDEKNSMESNARTFRLMYDFHASCMNRESTDRRGIEPLMAYIHKYGGWPLLEPNMWSHANHKWDWVDTSARIANDGFTTGIFSVNIDFDLKNTSRRLLTV